MMGNPYTCKDALYTESELRPHLFLRVERYDADHRSEDFLLHEPGVVTHICDHSGRQKVTLENKGLESDLWSLMA